MKRFLLIGISLLMSIASCPATSATSQGKLADINHKISSVKQDLLEEKNKRAETLQALKKTEITAGKTEQQLNKIKSQLQVQQKNLSRLQIQTQQNQQTLEMQEAALQKQLRAAYMLGRQPYLKLLLNQENPDKVSRLLTYYHYINKDRMELISQLQTTLQTIKTNQQNIQQQVQQLSTLKQKQQDTRNKLQNINSNRLQLLSTLNQHIQTKNQKLEQLMTDKQQLEKTIAALEAQSQRNKQVAVNGRFGQLKGKLSWPTKGPLAQSFGTQISQSELRWDGDLINAPLGQPVYAVANGTVIFAKWLSGYGLIMIINHGDGYMTLYGRSQSLYKKVGDNVRAGDLIATVGNSGGYDQPGLYFAVRYNGKAINPSIWCR